MNGTATGNSLAFALVVVGVLVLGQISSLHGESSGSMPRDAELKQNLHSIQLALERYAVDHHNEYPLFVMGGDWTDSYVVYLDWVHKHKAEYGLKRGKQYLFDGAWMSASPGMGDALIMDGYMPEFPRNPFIRRPSSTLLNSVSHLAANNVLCYRNIGGETGNRMAEIFGPQYLGQEYAGDLFVHHIFNNPPYMISDIRKETTPRGPVDFSRPSGNNVLVGNFSYYACPAQEALPWLRQGVFGELHIKAVMGYTLAGYGSVRTAGQDVYNRNGNYKGRYRTEDCATDCSEHQLFPDDVPCICPGDNSQPSHLKNNGGSDTLPDGVIITLDSGMKQGRYGKFLPGDDDPTPPAGPK